MRLRLFASLFFLLVLSGCNLQNLQPAPDLTNLVETQKRAEAAYQSENWQTAEKEYLYLTQNSPREIEPWFRLGNIYARTNRLDAAVATYREALVRDQKNSKIWHNLGIVHLRQSTSTFIEMLQYTDVNDPLNQRAKLIVQSVDELLTNEFGSAETE